MPAFDEEAVRGEVRKLIMDVLARKKSAVGHERVVAGVSLTVQLGIDSLDILQIMAVAEKRFGIKIPEEELKSMDDLGGIVAAVRTHWPAS